MPGVFFLQYFRLWLVVPARYNTGRAWFILDVLQPRHSVRLSGFRCCQRHSFPPTASLPWVLAHRRRSQARQRRRHRTFLLGSSRASVWFGLILCSAWRPCFDPVLPLRNLDRLGLLADEGSIKPGGTIPSGTVREAQAVSGARRCSAWRCATAAAIASTSWFAAFDVAYIFGSARY